jgi:Secretion system C-terminal sorting domain
LALSHQTFVVSNHINKPIVMKLFASLFTLLFLMVSSASFAATINVTGDISTNTTWLRTNVYVLKTGFHYVKNNATLTIESGTLIKGEGGTLVVTRGSKLEAVGTALRPIVFTSSKAAGTRVAGDWGGIILLGKASINDPAGERVVEGGVDATLGKYGPGPGVAADDNDNSGTLKYVRIEYAGIFYIANNEVNALTMGGVGKGTTIQYVQVSYGNDDAFEWFGGTVDAKYLVSNRTLDDDFDTDYGFTGNVQFGLIIRDPAIADISRSNMFESDNDASGSQNGPKTSGKFSNITALGPIQASPANTFNSLYGRALHIRRSSECDVYNSVFTGYPVGLMIDGTNSINSANAGNLQFKNNLLAGITGLTVDSVYTGTAPSFDPAAWFTANANTTETSPIGFYTSPYTTTTMPSFKAVAGTVATTGASFTGLPTFFTATSYRGAFSTSTANWSDCWTEFNTQNVTYTNSTSINYTPTVAIAPTAGTVGTVLTVTAAAGSTYKWYRDGAAIGGAASVAGTYTATLPGTYKCLVTSARKCIKYTSNAVIGSGLVVADGTTTANESVLGMDITPNPANNAAKVEFDAVTEGAANLTISDLMGRTISTFNTEVVEGTNVVDLDVATLTNGIYVITLNMDGQMISTRIQVQH